MASCQVVSRLNNQKGGIMDFITVTRPVIVKVLVTAAYKKALAAEMHGKLAELEGRIEQFGLYYKKISESEKNNPKQSGLQQIEVEIQKLMEKKGQLAERLREVGQLAEGQEVVHGRVESFVDINIGDRWADVMFSEVILKDGIVVEIRQGGLSEGV